MVTAERSRTGRSLAGKKMTEDELIALPDDGRKYELVDGRAKEVPTGARHGRIGTRLIRMLGPYADTVGEIFDSSTGFRMPAGNIRSPDVSVVLRSRFPDGRVPAGYLDGAPDLAVEIVSPTEDRNDASRKIGEYFDAGAQQVWIVQPVTRTVTVYHSMDRVRTYEAHEELEGGDLLPGFRCVVSDVFMAL